MSPATDSRSARAERLRAALAKPMETFPAAAGRPAVSLGADALDAMLPEGGLAAGALHECVPAGYGDFAAALGFTLALATRIVRARPGGVLWAFPARFGSEQGRVHAPGLMAFGLDPRRVIEVGVKKTHAMLWVMEEALGAGGSGQGALAAVIGIEAGGTGRDYDFTASRRLAMRAGKSGVTALLIRNHEQEGAATAAATRWRIATEPHAPGLGVPGRRVLREHQNPGVGAPRWAVSLIKSKRGMPGHRQVVEWDHETLSFRMAAALADRTASRRPAEQAVRQGAQQGWAAAS